MIVKTPERSERARRVKSLRKMTGLSRRKFAKEAGFAYSTLQHWEDPEDGLPESTAREFLKVLPHFGIHCSYEWLMYGTGTTPEILNRLQSFVQQFPENHVEKEKVSADTVQIAKELFVFMEQSSNSVNLRVPDNAMEPRFIAGELVAGIRKYGQDIQNLVGQDCIVLVQGGDIYLRTILKGSLEGSYHLAPLNPKTYAAKPFLYNVELVSAAPIIWARRSLNSSFEKTDLSF
jgi:transcriptional regulator with XRE-family HTH domain